MFSIYYIASESNQVCLWLPYILNTTKSQWKYNEWIPILLRAARQWAWWRDDVCSDVYRYYFCTNCTNTQCLLPAAGAERRRTFASWVILIGCAKTDETITGNITGSFCIFLLANPAWPSYRRIARSISNKMIDVIWPPPLPTRKLRPYGSIEMCVLLLFNIMGFLTFFFLFPLLQNSNNPVPASQNVTKHH